MAEEAEVDYRTLARLTQPRKELILDFLCQTKTLNLPHIYGHPGDPKWTYELHKFIHERNRTITIDDVRRWMAGQWGRYLIRNETNGSDAREKSSSNKTLALVPVPVSVSRGKVIPTEMQKKIDQSPISRQNQPQPQRQGPRQLPILPKPIKLQSQAENMNARSMAMSRSRSSTPSSLSSVSSTSESEESNDSEPELVSESESSSSHNHNNVNPPTATAAVAALPWNSSSHPNSNNNNNSNLNFTSRHNWSGNENENANANAQNLARGIMSGRLGPGSGQASTATMTSNRGEKQKQPNILAGENENLLEFELEMDTRSLYQNVFEAIEIIHDACTKIPAVKPCLLPLEEISKVFHRNHHKLIFPRCYSQVAMAVHVAGNSNLNAANAGTTSTTMSASVQRRNIVKVEPTLPLNMPMSMPMPMQGSFTFQQNQQQQQPEIPFRNFENVQQSNFHLLSSQISTVHTRNSMNVDDDVNFVGSMLRTASASGLWTAGGASGHNLQGQGQGQGQGHGQGISSMDNHNIYTNI